MCQDEINQIVNDLVKATIADNKKVIVQEIAKDINWEDNWKQPIAQAAVNAVAISTRLSVQLVLTLLVQGGVIDISEDALRPQLTVIRGGADSESSDQSPQQ